MSTHDAAHWRLRGVRVELGATHHTNPVQPPVLRVAGAHSASLGKLNSRSVDSSPVICRVRRSF